MFVIWQTDKIPVQVYQFVYFPTELCCLQKGHRSCRSFHTGLLLIDVCAMLLKYCFRCDILLRTSLLLIIVTYLIANICQVLSLCHCSKLYITNSHQLYDVATVIPIFHMRKQGHQVVKYFSQDYTCIFKLSNVTFLTMVPH